MESRPRRSDKLSYELWRIDWDRYLPFPVDETGRLSICAGEAEECLEFIRCNSKALFELDPQDNPFRQLHTSSARAKYYERTGDFLAFRDQDRLVGCFLGTPIDWDSYYLRHLCVLPDSRGSKWIEVAGCLVLRVLQEHGVSMAEADAAPSNLISAHVMNKLGFYAVGSSCTTRWGALVRYVKLLDPHSNKVFLDQFCLGIRPSAVLNANLSNERKLR